MPRAGIDRSGRPGRRGYDGSAGAAAHGIPGLRPDPSPSGELALAPPGCSARSTRFTAIDARGRTLWPTTTTSSSSGVGRAATPPPSTARRRASTSRSSSAPRSAGRASTSAASRPRSCWRRRPCTATSAGRPSSASQAGEPHLDWSVTMARKQKVVDNLFNGLRSLLRSRKVTIVDGVGRVAGEGTGRRRRRRRQRRPSCTAEHVILAAGSVPRTMPGFDVDGRIVVTSDELLSIEQLPSLRGRDRRRRHRLRVRLDDVRPRHHRSRSSRRCPRSCPAATRTSPTWSCARSRSGASTIRTGVQVSGHTPDRRTGPPPSSTSARATTSRSSWSVMSVGRRPFPDLLGLDGSGVEVDQRGYVEGRRALPHDRVRRVGHRRPRRHAPARPRGLRRGHHGHPRHPGRGSGPRRLRPGAVGHLLPPRGGLRRLLGGAGHGEGLRRRDVEAPLHRQRPGDDHRGDRGPGEGHRREAAGRDRRDGCWACTWSGRG